MATSTNLVVLRRLRDAVSRAYHLELADLDRQISTLERARPRPTTRVVGHAGRDHERDMLRVMQAAATPLPPREIAQRLDTAPKTVSRWLIAARRRGYVERVGHARYGVTKEVPPL